MGYCYGCLAVCLSNAIRALRCSKWKSNPLLCWVCAGLCCIVHAWVCAVSQSVTCVPFAGLCCVFNHHTCPSLQWVKEHGQLLVRVVSCAQQAWQAHRSTFDLSMLSFHAVIHAVMLHTIFSYQPLYGSDYQCLARDW